VPPSLTVGTTGYGLDIPGSIPGSVRFSLLHSVQTGSGAHPASYPMGTGDSLPQEGGGVQRQGYEAHHTPPSSAEVKKVELYLHSPICLHGIVFNKTQAQLYLTCPHLIHAPNVSKIQFYLELRITGGTRYRSWLRHYATSRKVAGSIPD
jgi:hypothetical protein